MKKASAQSSCQFRSYSYQRLAQKQHKLIQKLISVSFFFFWSFSFSLSPLFLFYYQPAPPLYSQPPHPTQPLTEGRTSYSHALVAVPTSSPPTPSPPPSPPSKLDSLPRTSVRLVFTPFLWEPPRPGVVERDLLPEF